MILLSRLQNTSYKLALASLAYLTLIIIRPNSSLASDFVLSQTFTMPDRTFSDIFGGSVAINGDNILIGAPGNNSNGFGVGRAYLFDGLTGDLTQTFIMPDGTVFDIFGQSVAIDAHNILIGAPGNDSDGNGVGRAYLFDGLTGDLTQTFIMPDVTGVDSFGWSVAIDGHNILIGAPNNDSDGNSVGRAYLFDGLTGDLTQTFTMPDVTEFDNFGDSVAIDGDNILIGAPGHESINPPVGGIGRAYLFDGLTGDLNQTFTMPDVTGVDNFGDSVAIDGDNILIGAPGNDSDGDFVGRAYLFDGLTGDLTQTFTMPDVTEFDNFGDSVAIDGDNILIGAPGHESINPPVGGIGRAYLFDGLTGDLNQTFTMPDVTGVDRFGGSVAIDGDNILIGAPGNDSDGNAVGRAYLFKSVPEPSSIIGLGILTTFGIGTGFKRKLSKANKK